MDTSEHSFTEFVGLTEAAKLLKKSRTTTYKLVREHNVEVFDQKARMGRPLYRRSDIEALLEVIPKDYEPLMNHALHKECKGRDGWHCVICGQRKNLAAHHIVPVSLGGQDHIDNLVSLCSLCHRCVDKPSKTRRGFYARAERCGSLPIAKWLVCAAHGVE